MKNSRRIPAAIAVFMILLAIGAFYYLRSKDQPAAQTVAINSPAPVKVPKTETAVVPEVEEAEPVAQPAVAAIPEQSEEVEVAESDEEPVHYYNGMNPEDQPRAFYDLPLAMRSSLPAGFTATGDFRLNGGWTLVNPSSGEEDMPRTALIESPPIKLDFPVNAINPMWREDSPPGTEVLVEVALSPDGVNWTDWLPTTSSHYEGEMEAFYPDGRPNPNYGFTVGEMTFYGLKLFEYCKFTMTLYSETAESPTVSNFRFFYQDSTMGEGRIAEVTEMSTDQKGF